MASSKSSLQYNLLDWIYNEEIRSKGIIQTNKEMEETEERSGFIQKLLHTVILPTIATIPTNEGQLFFQDVIQRIQS